MRELEQAVVVEPLHHRRADGRVDSRDGGNPGRDARITTFVVPASVQCGAASKTTVHIEYGVSHAARQEISVDGLTVPGVDAATGTVDAPVHCDGVAHTVALIAFDAKGARTAQVKYLNTLLPG